MKKLCSVPDCERRYMARGYCGPHYYRAFPRKGLKMPPIDAPFRAARGTIINGMGNHRRRMYKLEAVQWDALKAVQDNQCAICSVPLEDGEVAHQACVDHDHATGQIRGLLCRNCNIGLGMFKDNVMLLQEAAAYIVAGQAVEVQIPRDRGSGGGGSSLLHEPLVAG